jgi:hypothetical protein
VKETTPALVLGPMLRHAGTESATLSVETSGPRELEIPGHRTSTFAVAEDELRHPPPRRDERSGRRERPGRRSAIAPGKV